MFPMLPIGQLQIELHARPGSGHETFAAFNSWWESLEAVGLRPFFAEPNLVYVNLVRGVRPDLVEVSTAESVLRIFADGYAYSIRCSTSAETTRWCPIITTHHRYASPQHVRILLYSCPVQARGYGIVLDCATYITVLPGATDTDSRVTCRLTFTPYPCILQ